LIAMSDFSKTVTDENFDELVIEASHHTPVVVDVWAPWCGPCRMLTPVLDKLAEEYAGRFVLAKVNADENPEISGRYNVRSIPSVMAFVEGEVVDQFLGAQPESGVRQFIDQILPTPAALLRREAAAQRASGAIEVALEALQRAAALEPRNEEVLADLIDVLLDLRRSDEATQAGTRLRALMPSSQRAARALARLDLSANAGEETDVGTLEARIAAHPDDLDARLSLARTYASQQSHEQALAQLLEILHRDRKFGDDVARKTMLALFELLGADHPLVRKYRKALAAALY
jgi:putative thioredoxin